MISAPNGDPWPRTPDVPGQWICWDFHERRVRLSHYRIMGASLKSWVLEGMQDDERWIVLHRHTD
jgi:hypothetical protein